MRSSRPLAPAPGRAGLATLAWVAIVAALAAAALLSGMVPLPWSGPSESMAAQGVPVRRGPLRIVALVSGSLNPAETISLVSAVEGRTSILDIVPEGSRVTKGQLVCELDATLMSQERVQQAIELGNADASLVKARQALEIQKSQNFSDKSQAAQAIEFARQDLEMFLEGERDSELQSANQSIDLAREDAQRARDEMEWSRKLAEKGFLTSTEYEADRIAERRAAVALEQAQRTLDLMERYRMPRREAELRAALEETQRESERVELQAAAKLVDFEAAVRSYTAIRELEQEKLARLDTQIEKARMRAPRDGFVVYSQRDSDEPPIQAGTEVREREEILRIPSSTGMLAEVKLHESVLEQVQPGLACTLKVDALPGAQLEGTVANVAMLPDRQSRWLNPNLRVYRCDIRIETQHAGLRPGMSCSAEILIDVLPDDTLYVPVQAVFREGTQTHAFVARGERYERRLVEIGRYNDLWVQITFGLDEGEIVLLQPPVGAATGPQAPAAGKPAAGAAAPASR